MLTFYMLTFYKLAFYKLAFYMFAFYTMAFLSWLFLSITFIDHSCNNNQENIMVLIVINRYFDSDLVWRMQLIIIKS